MALAGVARLAGFYGRKALLLPLAALAAGSLLGGALPHLLPEAVAARGPGLGTFLPALAGFALFFLIGAFDISITMHTFPRIIPL
jgi:hypothetical protein